MTWHKQDVEKDLGIFLTKLLTEKETQGVFNVDMNEGYETITALKMLR